MVIDCGRDFGGLPARFASRAVRVVYDDGSDDVFVNLDENTLDEPVEAPDEGDAQGDEATVGDDAVIGDGTTIHSGARVMAGCEIGRDVNVGAGTITCNYDGVNKHRTVIVSPATSRSRNARPGRPSIITAGMDGDVDIETMSGMIELIVDAGASASYDLSTFSGSINNDIGPEPRRTSKYTPGRELSFNTGPGGPRISLNSFSGTIKLMTR